MNAIQISWVLAAEDSVRLARFYSELFQATLVPGVAQHHSIVQFSDGTRLEIYRPSRRRPFPARGRALAPCLRLPPSQQPLPELQRGCSATPCSVVDRFWRRRGLSPLVRRPGSTILRAIPCCFWLPWPLPLRSHDRFDSGGLQCLHSL